MSLWKICFPYAHALDDVILMWSWTFSWKVSRMKCWGTLFCLAKNSILETICNSPQQVRLCCFSLGGPPYKFRGTILFFFNLFRLFKMASRWRAENKAKNEIFYPTLEFYILRLEMASKCKLISVNPFQTQFWNPRVVAVPFMAAIFLLVFSPCRDIVTSCVIGFLYSHWNLDFSLIAWSEVQFFAGNTWKTLDSDRHLSKFPLTNGWDWSPLVSGKPSSGILFDIGC